MITSVTATYAKNNLGGLMDKVIATRKKILIKKAGKPAVYIVPVTEKYELDFSREDFEKLEKGVKEFRKSFKFNF